MLESFLERKTEIISSTDPNRIFTENVRSFFWIPKPLAVLVCEMAVKEGWFEAAYGVTCRNKRCRRIIESSKDLNKIGEKVICHVCLANEENMNL